MKIISNKQAVLGALILTASIGAGVMYFLTTREGKKWKMDMKNLASRRIEKYGRRKTYDRKLITETDPKNNKFNMERMDDDYVPTIDKSSERLYTDG